jgi:4-amino-4-deoxy-L-arabinose transferase-like glycosyltransferase
MRGADRWLLGMAALAIAALSIGLGSTDFFPPDEARVAEVSREMAAGESWLIPHLNGRRFLEEPPLFYWLQAGLYRVAGAPTTLTARLPAAAAATAGALFTGAIAFGLGADPMLAMLVLATAPEYWWMARSATPDAAAAAAVTLSLGLFFSAWQSGSRRRLVAAAVAAGGAFWCKSFLPVGLVVVTTVPFLACAGWGRLRARDLALAVGALIGIVTVWILSLAYGAGASAVRFFVVTNHFGRLVHLPSQGHVRSALYYAPNLALGLFPWSVVLPAALVAAWRQRSLPARLFPLLWGTAMCIVLSFSATKRAHYVLSAYPAFALLIAQWWSAAPHSAFDRVVRRAMIVLLVAVGPVLTLVLLGIGPREAMVVAAQGNIGAWSKWLLHLAPSQWAWLAAALALLAGFIVVRTDHRSSVRTATALGAYLTALHLLITLIALPAFNPFCTARPWGEWLGRTASRTRMVAFGFRDSEALSPFLFYGRRRVPEIDRARALVAQLRGRPSCALIRETDYAKLASALPASPAVRGRVGALRFVLVESAPGVCLSASAPRSPVS